MKRKIIDVGSVLLLLIIVLFFGRKNSNNNQSEDMREIIVLDKVLQNGVVNLFENATEEDEMDRHYGHYRITQFCPTKYYGHLKYDTLPNQEADMMLERTVIIEPDLLVTYDSERCLGTREGRDWFSMNYKIEEYIMENPQYECISITSDNLDYGLKPDFEMEWAIDNELFDQIESVIIIPKLCSPFGTQYYYTLTDENKVILYSTLSMQYFLLEKISEEEEKVLPEQLSDMQKNMLLDEVYGDYEITEFLPTKFYPALDSSGYEILPQQEADMMLGQKIVIGEEMFCTYDNYRQPNSVFCNRLDDGFWIEKVEIENPEYQVESKLREDIYGLRDDMLPSNLLQKEYIEIDVFPGYYISGPIRVLPQLFLVEDGHIIMYAMGEYFLLREL